MNYLIKKGIIMVSKQNSEKNKFWISGDSLRQAIALRNRIKAIRFRCFNCQYEWTPIKIDAEKLRCARCHSVSTVRLSNTHGENN